MTRNKTLLVADLGSGELRVEEHREVFDTRFETSPAGVIDLRCKHVETVSREHVGREALLWLFYGDRLSTEGVTVDHIALEVPMLCKDWYQEELDLMKRGDTLSSK